MPAASPDPAAPTHHADPAGGVALRAPADGEAVLPWLVGLMVADGRCRPVPVERRRTLPDGGLQLDGSAHGFTARLRLAPGATSRRAELTVRREAPTPADAGLRVELRLGPTDDPGWLIPGAFYGQNRLPDCARPYPRYQAGTHDPEGMVADAWSLRADRCATPAVFARDQRGGAALACAEHGQLGPQGVGLALAEGGRPALRLHAPYREEPVSYYGSATPLPPDTPLHRWAPGEERTVTFTVHLLDADPHAYAPVLRELADAAAWEGPPEPAAWVGLVEAAELTAHGLHRWHYRADPPVLLETVAFDREALGAAGDRQAMHVSWISGTPYAHALLAHARRVGDAPQAAAAVAVLDHIAQHRTPAGTFWGQWTESGGWGAGWTGDRQRLHSRTLGDATLFLLRALIAERALGHDHPEWERAVRANLAVAAGGADPASGRLAAAHHTDTGAALSHRGSAGLAWIAPLVEAAEAFAEPDLLAVARRAGAAYAADLHGEFLCGAPEDVSLAPTSEDGYNAVIAYTLLHEAGLVDDAEPGQRDGRWLELARRAAEWTLTFRYSYDVRFDPHTVLAQYGFRTRGLDQASPSNQHLHAFGLVCLPEWVRLARHLDDPALLRSARENLDACRQFVARADGDFNAYRGMVTERFYQTDCFQAKGMVLTLSHAWTVGLLLYACEVALGLPEFAAEAKGAPA
ncbi:MULTISPECIES: hypothetical protein [Streptomyces]|uniref:hypothetical protein n=1 Tax=Streptomyces TaxID=1883 RepID=UPI00186ABDB1|nr:MULTISPECIES: hypothetical protein [Streptomyces]